MRSRRWICLLLLALVGCNNGGINSGDRVLVAKCLYETGLKPPERFDVVVFKYPAGPMKGHVPTNYIKRLLGLPGEIIAIFFGQIFHYTPAPGEVIPGLPPTDDPLDLWHGGATSPPTTSDEFKAKIRELIENRKLEIVRKPPSVMMAMRRIVNDNNYQPTDMKSIPDSARWQPKDGSSWKASPDRKAFTFAPGDGKVVDWLTYQHRVRPEGPLVGGAKIPPQLITDTMGYNSFNLDRKDNRDRMSINWVGDLMLEATVKVTQPTGEFVMELNKGPNRFQAKWDLASGQCTLFKIAEDGSSEKLGEAATSLRGVGEHTVRFANFDSRLTVWVGRDLPFGDGVPYDPPEFTPKNRDEKFTFNDLRENWGPRPNDLERPASFGAKGAGVEVSNVSLWRDTYYTMNVPNVQNADVPNLTPEILSNPNSKEWEKFKELHPIAFYVHPKHYMCLGDNSTHSSDSRSWGLVPERLMLGRALMVYYPLNRAGLIR